MGRSMTETTQNGENAAAMKRMDQREAEATTRIEEADAANRTALGALSAFLAEIQIAKRLLAGRPDLAVTLMRARDDVGRTQDSTDEEREP